MTIHAQEVARCQATDARSSLAQVAAAYRGLQTGYWEEYVMYNLASAALAQVPFSWRPHLHCPRLQLPCCTGSPLLPGLHRPHCGPQPRVWAAATSTHFGFVLALITQPGAAAPHEVLPLHLAFERDMLVTPESRL